MSGGFANNDRQTEAMKAPPPKPKPVVEDVLDERGLKHVVHPDTDLKADLPPLSLTKANQEALAEKQFKIGAPWLTGGFGVIYTATSGEGHEEKQLAAKVVDLAGLPSNYAKDVAKWKDLKHAHVNPAKEIMTLDEPTRLLVIMELCDYDLQELVLSQPQWVPKKLAAAYYYQLNKGLAYMHGPKHKFAHRNIKPRYLLISRARGNELRISDCGMSRVSFAIHNKDSIANFDNWHDTFGYLAPEVFGGKHDFCPMAADMWSVSSVLHFLVYKTFAFQSFNLDPAEMLASQKKHDVRITKRVEPLEENGEGNIGEVQDALVQHWHEDPAKRPTASKVIDEFATLYGKWSNWEPTARPGGPMWHFP